jgi:hypothetical protein
VREVIIPIFIGPAAAVVEDLAWALLGLGLELQAASSPAEARSATEVVATRLRCWCGVPLLGRLGAPILLGCRIMQEFPLRAGSALATGIQQRETTSYNYLSISTLFV